MAVVTVATCQFPVTADVPTNLRWIERQARHAKRQGADVAHFPEGALSGYAGVDLPSFNGFNWPVLRRATERVLDVARRNAVWIILGSAHPLDDGLKPHNSLYVIDQSGALIERYDKRFCSGDAAGQSGDLAHYTPGTHFSAWTIDGVRCGALVCYDYRFPELVRRYRQMGVDLIFHSFHAANATPQRMDAIAQAIGTDYRSLNAAPTFTYPGITMPATMTAASAANHVWISCSNSSARESMWPAFLIRADGITVGRLRRNVSGVLVTRVDTGAQLYDSTANWRDNAISGVLNSGVAVEHPRSAERRSL